jgi:hypothetical protein
MSYTINHYNGTLQASVADGTVDTSTDLVFIGKNYAGYGQAQNDNFLWMLENFCNTTQPSKPVTGQIWYDSANKRIKFYNGSIFRSVSTIEYSSTTPVGLTQGDFWFNTASNQLYAFNNLGAPVLIGPQEVLNAGTTQMLSTALLDSSNNSKPVIQGISGGNVVFIISSSSFTLNGANAITGFDYIVQGITLVNTGLASGGVTTGGYKFQGTSSNSDRLGGQPASSFIQSGNATFSSIVNFSDAGYTVGNPNVKLTVFNNSGVPTIQSATNIIFNTTTQSGSTKNPLVLNGSDVLPGQSGVSNLGNSSYQWASLYAGYVYSTAQKADFLNVGGNYQATSVASVANTIVARDSSSNINANLFNGTATSAQYADLAEKYLADQEYEAGTVVKIGGEKEVTAGTWGSHAIGVVSINPAYMMNSELEGGTYIALKGRVPVKVSGTVNKGDELIAADNGCATVAAPHASGVFAVALSSSDDTGVKLVECLVL